MKAIHHFKHSNIDEMLKTLEETPEDQAATQQNKKNEMQEIQENYRKAGIFMRQLIEERQAEKTKTAIVKELKTKKHQAQKPVRKI